jgi:hypothetical protein
MAEPRDGEGVGAGGRRAGRLHSSSGRLTAKPTRLQWPSKAWNVAWRVYVRGSEATWFNLTSASTSTTSPSSNSIRGAFAAICSFNSAMYSARIRPISFHNRAAPAKNSFDLQDHACSMLQWADRSKVLGIACGCERRRRRIFGNCRALGGKLCGSPSAVGITRWRLSFQLRSAGGGLRGWICGARISIAKCEKFQEADQQRTNHSTDLDLVWR